MNINYEEIQKQIDLLKSQEELEKMKLSNEEIMARIIENSDKNRAEIAKMTAEADKIRKETKYYPLVIVLTGAFTVIAVALINKLL